MPSETCHMKSQNEVLYITAGCKMRCASQLGAKPGVPHSVPNTFDVVRGSENVQGEFKRFLWWNNHNRTINRNWIFNPWYNANHGVCPCVHMFGCLPFPAVASCPAFEKLNIHLWNDAGTGMSNVDVKFYFTSRLVCHLFRQIQPPPPDVSPPPFCRGRYK